jgi:hypothetical protein
MKDQKLIVQFEAIFRATPSACLILGTDAPRFTIIAINNAYLEITTTVRETITGKGLFEVFPDNPQDPMSIWVTNLIKSLRKVLETKKAHKMPIHRCDIQKLESTSFEMKYWEPQNAPVLNENEEILYIMHSVFDVTEKVPLEREEKFVLEELTRAGQNISKSNEELKRLTLL